MAHKWDWGATTFQTWHGKEEENGVRLPPGTSVPVGIKFSRIEDVEWSKIPQCAKSRSGKYVQIDGQYLLERSPRPWVPNDDYHILAGRTVGEEFEVVQGSDLAKLARNVADHTGWQFASAANLQDSEITYIQLDINKDFRIGGKTHEAHKAKLFFGDDKSGGAMFGGITCTRIQCWNTWKAALSEEGVWRLRHDDSPTDRMEFVAAQVVKAYEAMEEEERWLSIFFNKEMADYLFDRFNHEVFPDPQVTQSMIEAEEAREMLAEGNTNGFDIYPVIALGERSQKGYEQRLALAEKRRGYMENAYENHNRKFGDSANTYYAAVQALTQTTTHGPFRGDPELGTLFGVRGDYSTKGLKWLKEACENG